MSISERDERVRRDECSVSTHEFKLHDWRWLAWPLSNTSARGRWCRLCGLTQGQPDGQCQTQNCFEYAAGGNHFCEFCQQNQTILDAATRMRDRCVSKVREIPLPWHHPFCETQTETGCNCFLRNLRTAIVTALESLTLEQVEQEK